MAVVRIFAAVVLCLSFTITSVRADVQSARKAYDNQDFKTALRLYLPLADAGSVEAQLHVGLIQFQRRDGKQDPGIAARYLKPAANAGNEGAEFLLGRLYTGDIGHPVDYTQARRWLEQAAAQGVSLAARRIAMLYLDGSGVVKNGNKAADWFQKAITLGGDLSWLYLGELYLSGRDGLRENEPLAMALLYEAAARGVLPALNLLGRVYARDNDYSSAVRFLKLAAEAEHTPSQTLWGALLYAGEGVSSDEVEGLAWLYLAESRGDKEAVEALDQIYSDGTSIKKEQILKKLGELTVRRNTDFRSVIQGIASMIPGAPRVSSTLANLDQMPASDSKEAPGSTLSLHFPQGPERPDDVAIVIGNSDYGKQGRDIPNVVPAHSDSEGIRQWLLKAKGLREGNIIFLKDATAAQMIGVFGNQNSHRGKLFNWTKPGKSNIYVYYAGHGAPGAEGQSAVLVPSDAAADTLDLVGYSLETLYRNLAKIPAKSITVILEACFSGNSQAGSVVARTSGLLIAPKIPQAGGNITVISAGAADQVASWEEDGSHSLFTKYFLKAMSGEGDKAPYGNGDGKTDYAELGKYLSDTLTYYARRYYGRTQTAQIVVR